MWGFFFLVLFSENGELSFFLIPDGLFLVQKQFSLFGSNKDTIACLLFYQSDLKKYFEDNITFKTCAQRVMAVAPQRSMSGGLVTFTRSLRTVTHR